TVEQLARQVEPEYTPARKVHFYHCDHRGLPLALISEDGNTAWRGEYDEWGNQLNEENPHHLHQPYRLPGQQHDEESGLYYNRHRHYDPLQGRYITPDPIGLRGGWNMYQYPLNPIQVIDPMGLDAIENMTSGGLIYAVSGVPGLIAANSITNSAYQFGYDMDAIVGGAHNGAADAMRHCYLMCRMTKTFGSTIADVIGKNHEAAGDRQGQPAKERIMDLKNNTVGIACGDFSAKCSDACIEKYNTGQIINDQKISRGNGHFISIMVNNYRTHCGVVDINLNFFNDILYSVRLKNISKLENMEFCATKQRVYFSDKNKKASYKIINYGDYYDVDYYDNNLKNEVFDWIGKWS
ncbi:YdcD family protein, partial [Escherichia coli]